MLLPVCPKGPMAKKLMSNPVEVRIFKLCHTIIVVERTGIQWVQKM